MISISDDDDVVVLRIKNRLDLAYDSALSAGYRDVCMNLRFSSELTQSLGLEWHVCEVQLVLLPYAKLKVYNVYLTIHCTDNEPLAGFLAFMFFMYFRLALQV